MQQFIDSILSNLKANGFPEKRVSLPAEKMYEAADHRDLNFNKVLEELEKSHGIASERRDERIVFSPAETTSQADMMKQAQEMMKNMDPQELARIQEMVQNMSDDEKSDLMAKAKNMGLF